MLRTPNSVTILLASLLFALVHIGIAGAASSPSVINIYVSPEGNDNNDGMSSSTPVQTLTKAQALERSNNPAQNAVAVNVMPGVYVLQNTLSFNASDSGSTWQSFNSGIIEISGGTSITNQWTLSSGLYQTSYSGLFRQLYVNGIRATRSRSAESYIVDIEYNQTMPDGTVAPVAIVVNTADVPTMSGLNTTNAPEIHYGLSGVGFNIARIASIQQRNATTSWIVPMPNVMTPDFQPMVSGNTGPQAHQAFFFENAKELLDQPGEWFFDSAASILYYMPRVGENISTAMVIAPTFGDAGPLITINDASNLTIKGFTFEYTNWTEPSYQGLFSNEGGRIYEPSPSHYPNPNLPSTSYSWPNAEIPFGAVVISGWNSTQMATNITIEGNTFRHLGASGLDVWEYANNISIVGNVFEDISANGITIDNVNAGVNPGDATDPQNVSINNNFIAAVGQDYQGSVAIYGLYPNTLSIFHNEMYNLPNAGIFLDSNLTSSLTSTQNNDIEYNKISSVLRKRWDAAGIYINSYQGGSGTIIANNSITNTIGALSEQIWTISASCSSGTASDNPGISLDAGTNNVTVQNNYINNVPLVWCVPGSPNNGLPNYVLGSAGTNGVIGANGSDVAVNGAGLQSAYTGIRPALAPAAPTNLSATTNDDGTIALTWVDNSNNEDGFDIERWDSTANNWARVTTQGSNSIAYNDTRLQSGVAYSYRIAAINDGGISQYSNTVSIVAPTKSFIDTTTQGNWKGKYGSQGYYILADNSGATNPVYPPYAQVNPISGNLASPWAYVASTDPRGLQQINGTSRTLGAWWDGNPQGTGSIVLDINLSDGQSHQVAIYSVDFYSQSRYETVTLKDPATGLILDSQTISNFVNGVNAGFNASGHVQLVLTSSNGSEIANAFFLDPYTPHIVAPVADLSISAAPSVSSINVGGTLTYDMTIANNGPANASGVAVSDVLPAGVTYVPGSSSANCSNTAGTITCQIGNLASGANASVVITVTVNASASNTLTNSANVTGNESDPTLANNTASVSVTVNPVADLTITLSASPSTVNLGGTITYTATVTNNGPSAASGVTVSGLTGCTLSSTSIQSGGNASCTVSAVANTVGTVTQTASASGAQMDPNTANNSATVTTTVNAPDLIPTAMSATKSGSKVYVSDTIKNQGNGNAGSFTVGYYLSTNTSYEPGTDLPLVNSSGSACTRTVSSLSPGVTSSVSNLTCYKPANVVTGQKYYVLVVDDVNNKVIELNETNNVKATTGQVWW